MNNFIKILGVFLVLFLFGFFVYYQNNEKYVAPEVVVDNIKGCYVSTLEKDVYTLIISSQDEENFTGKLSFKNYQKDSSSGVYVGTYKDDILLGEYSFASEGMDSVVQIIFKRSGDTFIRGHGEADTTGTRFKDLDNIVFDNSQVFQKTNICPSV